MPQLGGALLVATALLLARPVHGYPSSLGCQRSITAGNTIMNAAVAIGSASIKLQKGGTPFACGSSLTAGDTGLTFTVSGQGLQYVVEAIASAGTGSWGIQGGKCSMQRQDNTDSNTYTVPASGTVTVRVAAGNPVRVSPDCTYQVIAASTPSSPPQHHSSPPASPPASPPSPSSSPTTPATATPPPANVAILSAAEKAVAPKVVSKMTLDRELTATEQVSTRSAYAAAAEVPVENVELSKGARRQSKVSYSVTVYVKDAAAAAAVSNKLSDPAVVKSALIAAVLLPDHTPLVRLCVCTRRGPSTVTPPFVPPAGSARLRRSSSSSSITFCLSTFLSSFPNYKDLNIALDLDTERILDDSLLLPCGCSYLLLSIVAGLFSRSDYIWNLTMQSH